MLVDVVIPAYGRPGLLTESIRSVLSQTHTEFNICVVDDATPAPLELQLSIRDPRLKFIRLEKNSGPAVARNRGVAVGSAPFVAFLDSDDLWHPEKLARQLSYLAENPQCQWVHTNEAWMRNGEPVRQRPEHRKQGGRFLVRAFERCLIAASAVMFRRAFFEKHGGFAEHFRVCEDYELWLRLLAAEPVGFIQEPLAIKRAGAWEQLSGKREIDRFRVLALHRFCRQIRPDAGLLEYVEPLLHEAEKKARLLLSGAQKYGNATRAKRYQAWLTLFNTLRTRDMRWSS